MSFTRWLYMNNKEKIIVFVKLLPIIIISFIISKLTSDHLLISAICSIGVVIFGLAFKNYIYIRVIAKKYDQDLDVTYQQMLIQSLGMLITNSLLMLVTIVGIGSFWLITIASKLAILNICAFILSLIGVVIYVMLGKLGYYTILDNIKNNKLSLSEYLNGFSRIYVANYRFILKLVLKLLCYNLVIGTVLSIISIQTAVGGYTALALIISIFSTFTISWIEITSIQYLSREYTKSN